MNNNNMTFDIIKILEKINKIDSTYDLLSEIFSDNINYASEPNLKYFILSKFFIKNSQLSFDETWKLFKVLISVNPNIIKDKNENNNLYALSLKNCVQLLLQGLTNVNIDKNFDFKNKEISSLFDFLFSIPLVKHFINLIGGQKPKEEIYDLLNKVGKLIYDKIRISKNNMIKNIFNNFFHFLNLNDININIKSNNNDVKINSSQNVKNGNNFNNSENSFVNEENVNLMNMSFFQKKITNNYNNMIFNNSISNSPSRFIERQNIKKDKNEKHYSNKKNKKFNEGKNKNNNNIRFSPIIPIVNKKNVSKEIKNLEKSIIEFVEKVNLFIKFDEMQKAVKEKLPGHKLIQIGSYFYTAPVPNANIVNVDLMLSKPNNESNYIKKYHNTFDTFKNIPNVKCCYFCLNKDRYFYECLNENKSIFHLTRTDEDESSKIYPFKNVTVHLYAYNMIYGYSSFFIKKLYSTLNNIWRLHLLYTVILLQEFPMLNSNYELSILIINFLQTNYKIFSEKSEEKPFTYFAYDSSKNYGFLTNFPLVKQYQKLFFYEYDADSINFIKEKSVLDLAKEFHKFMCKYFEFIYNDGQIPDKNRNYLNIFISNSFLDNKYIFNRIFMDTKFIKYKNNSFDEFLKIQNMFNALCFE